MKFFCFSCILLLLICNSCKTQNNSLDTNLLEVFLTNLTKSDSIYIIPETGCNSCIDKAFKFARNQNDNDRLFFVFTRVHDSKLLKNQLGINDSTVQTNIFIDNQNRLSDFGYVEIYPFLYTGGEIYYLNDSYFTNN